MLFLSKIEEYSSVSVVGLAKNVGKTECLKTILHHYRQRGEDIAFTSIGVDGEATDVVSKTAKPELFFYPGMLVQTSEQHYRQREAVTEILDVSDSATALGRLVFSRVRQGGRLILSGPSYTKTLHQYIDLAHRFGAKTALIDGALSRLSPASPALSEAMILCTGLSVSKHLPTLVKKTKYHYDLACLPSSDLPENTKNFLSDTQNGVWAVDDTGQIRDLKIPSILLMEKYKDRLLCAEKTLFVSGLVSSNFLNFLRLQKKKTCLLVKDFTRIFADELSYYAFIASSCEIRVLNAASILAVCVNPSSPDAYRIPSHEVREALTEALKVRVYDVIAEKNS